MSNEVMDGDDDEISGGILALLEQQKLRAEAAEQWQLQLPFSQVPSGT